MFFGCCKIIEKRLRKERNGDKNGFYGDELAFFLRQFVQTIINSVDRFWNDG